MAATVTNVASAAASTTLLAPNAQRKGVIIENSDTNRLHVRFGGTATTSDYTLSIAQNANTTIEGYTGLIVGIWAADGAGFAHVTEY